MGFWILDAVKDGFGGAGVVLAGLTSPEADFETGVVFDPAHLILEEVVLKHCFDELSSVHVGWDYGWAVGIAEFGFRGSSGAGSSGSSMSRMKGPERSQMIFPVRIFSA